MHVSGFGQRAGILGPVTGEIRHAMAFRQENGRTIMPLEFGPCGSVFVVFRKPIPWTRWERRRRIIRRCFANNAFGSMESEF